MGGYSPSPWEYYQQKYKQGHEILRSYHYKILELLPEEKQTILDVGSGTGKLAERIRDLGHRVICTDSSKQALLKNTDVDRLNLQLDLNRGLPFADKSFPFVVCSDVLEHVLKPHELLRKLHRVLTPDGELILVVPNSAHLFYRLLYLLGHVPEELQIPGHRHFFSEKSLRQLIRSTGFSIRNARGRNLYLALKESWIPGFLHPILRTLGFHREFSYSHDENLWIRTGPSNRTNSMLSDAFIFRLTKENKDHNSNETPVKS